MAMDGFYLLLDSAERPLAKGMMLSPPGSRQIHMKVLEDKADLVARHEIIQIVSMGKGVASLQTHLLRQRDDNVVLERISTLDPELRRSLRIPVKFDSFIYPLTGAWQGRQRVRSVDLSCGGVAFYGASGLAIGEQMEIVIPITTEPLIMRIQILRETDLQNDRTYYSSKFIDMCQDEEDKICEAVFSIQLENYHHHHGDESED